MDKIRSSKESPLTKRQKHTTLTHIFKPLFAEKSTPVKRKNTVGATYHILTQMITATSESQKEGTLVEITNSINVPQVSHIALGNQTM